MSDSSSGLTITPSTRLAGWEICVDRGAGHEDAGAPSFPTEHPQPIAALAHALGLPPGADLDELGFLYRCRFPRPPAEHTELCLPNIGTLAEVTLNGRVLGRLENLFRRARFDVGSLLADDNLLEVRILPLGPALQQKPTRPRPRWKTRITPQQSLRYVRTTLFGRMPGWTPPVPPVGLLGDVTIAPPPRFTLEGFVVRADDAGDGVVELALRGALPDATLQIGDVAAPIVEGKASLRIPQPRRWWPHTHGTPSLYSATIRHDGQEHPLAPVGFRTLTIDRGPDGRGFGLVCNGVGIFARGASWMPPEPRRFLSSPPAIDRALDDLVDAGMNLVRLSGTIGYESPYFHRACAARGLLVWQDFAFANLDYPTGDAALNAEIDAEVEELLSDLAASPSLAVLCGGSEVAQQAAMMGLPPEAQRSAIFDERLPALCARLRADVPYLPSTPSGGPRPFVVDEGVGHYYGVGAYLRPLGDARLAQVRFAAECLAFANVPEPATLEALLGPGEVAPHHPRWKQGVPRDLGVGWDFDDVRDHYVGALFDLDPAALRYADPDRYLELGRVATGEVIERTLGEWRRPGSSCRGALVWYLRDLQRGAGLGLVDADGRRKSVYSYARRALQPRTVLLVDEGQNGLRVHVVNDLDQPWAGTLRLELGRLPATTLDTVERAFECPPRGALSFDVEALFGRFFDAAYAFRFGPPGHDLVLAEATTTPAPDATAPPVPVQAPRAVWWRLPLPHARAHERDLSARATAADQAEGAAVLVELSSRSWRAAVALRAALWTPADNYFVLRPGETRVVRLTPDRPGARFVCEASSLFDPHPLPVELG